MSQTLLRMQTRYPLGPVMAPPTTLPPFIQNESETLMKSIFFASALWLCAAPLWAQDKVTLLLDWFVNPDHGPVIIAQERGYFAEQDLMVEVIAPADPSAPPKMVAAGQADLAISYQPQLHLQIHEGLPLQRVGTLVATPLSCLLVLADGPIETPADLRGRKVGFSVGGVEEAVLGHVLKTHGLTLDDVELINVNWSMSPSLMSGQVDAVIGAFRNFELNQMDIEGVPGRCFYVEEEGLPPYDELIYVANKGTMDTDMIQRFLAATEKATQYIVNHPVESWEIFASTTPELNDELNKRAWVDTLPRFALRPTAMDVGRYAMFEAFLHDAGLIPTINPVSRIAIDVTSQ
jgi:putative hydroxymethylpyrimidine transport system substrate-binding protein